MKTQHKIILSITTALLLFANVAFSCDDSSAIEKNDSQAIALNHDSKSMLPDTTQTVDCFYSNNADEPVCAK